MSTVDQTMRHLADVMLASRQFRPAMAVARLHGGANNRVYRIDTPDGPFCLKAYYHSPDQTRDRLHAEFAFTTYAWRLGVHTVPEPLLALPERHVALFRFVEGRRLQPGDIASHQVDSAVAFVRDLNPPGAGLPELPHGAEACFSIAEHLACIERRIQRLQTLPADTPISREASEFVGTSLTPAWERVNGTIRSHARDLQTSLPGSERCVSPSDFGFHNAILRSDDSLCFHDFEYAGLDDPAKLVGDFFCQPAVPVPLDYLPAVVDQVASMFPDADGCRERILLLRPLYQIKWCCILLNEFLPADVRRRHFADDAQDLQSRQAIQLTKAKHALQEI